jgi:hypothetical protein
MNTPPNPPPSSPPAFKFTPDYAIYPPKEQGIYPIREGDWVRLKRLISQIIPAKRVFEVLASAFFGVAGSALLSLVAFSTTSSLASWVLPTTWAIFIGSVILAIALIIVDRLQKQLVTTSVTNVLEEMQAIEQDYENPKSKLQKQGQSHPLSAQQIAEPDVTAANATFEKKESQPGGNAG